MAGRVIIERELIDALTKSLETSLSNSLNETLIKIAEKYGAGGVPFTSDELMRDFLPNSDQIINGRIAAREDIKNEVEIEVKSKKKKGKTNDKIDEKIPEKSITKTEKVEKTIDLTNKNENIDYCKCMARVWGSGEASATGPQCTRQKKDSSDYCLTHMKKFNDPQPYHLGRIDQPRPDLDYRNNSKLPWKFSKMKVTNDYKVLEDVELVEKVNKNDDTSGIINSVMQVDTALEDNTEKMSKEVDSDNKEKARKKKERKEKKRKKKEKEKLMQELAKEEDIGSSPEDSTGDNSIDNLEENVEEYVEENVEENVEEIEDDDEDEEIEAVQIELDGASYYWDKSTNKVYSTDGNNDCLGVLDQEQGEIVDF
jgi:hypothetical protein